MSKDTAAERITKYLEQKKLMRGVDEETIHLLKPGGEREASLSVSDLQEVVKDSIRFRAFFEAIVADSNEEDLTVQQMELKRAFGFSQAASVENVIAAIDSVLFKDKS